MATSVDHLKLQSEPVERKVKTLLNSDLKSICKSEGLQISGVKAALQGRILERLNDAVTSGDAARFNELRQKIYGPGGPDNDQATSGSVTLPTTSMTSLLQAQTRFPFGPVKNSPRITFKASPFYSFVESLTPMHDLPIMSSNRHTVTVRFTLFPTIVDRLRTEKNLRIVLYCGMDPGLSTSPSDIAFPSQVEVKVNNEIYHGNLRGIKKKSGTTRPADITDLVRKYQPNVQNSIQITYAATDKRFLVVVHLVRKHGTPELLETIRKAHFISKESVLKEMKQKANDPDVMTTSTVMSLKCPISTVRIELPCRSDACTHNQCFDAASFLQMQEQAPQWSCPICGKAIPFQNLHVDGYVQDIIASVPKSVEQVTIEPGGAWKQGSHISDFKSPNAGSKRRHSETVDFDDVVEITTNKLNGVRKDSLYDTPQSMARTPTGFSREPSAATSTTQRSSGSKRQSEVIDLTLSDDDEPPRPLKRQSTSFSQHQAPFSLTNNLSTQSFSTNQPQNSPHVPHLQMQSPTLPNYGSQFGSLPARPSNFSFQIPNQQNRPPQLQQAPPYSPPLPPYSPSYGGWR